MRPFLLLLLFFCTAQAQDTPQWLPPSLARPPYDPQLMQQQREEYERRQRERKREQEQQLRAAYVPGEKACDDSITKDFCEFLNTQPTEPHNSAVAECARKHPTYARYSILRCAAMEIGWTDTWRLRPPEVADRPLSADQIALVKRTMVSVLRDPDSAKFGAIKGRYQGDDRWMVCGFINATNAYGGYTGMMPFIGVLRGNSFLPADIASDWSKAMTIERRCRALGVPL